MSVAGWMGLLFIWVAVSFFIALIATISRRQEMPLRTVRRPDGQAEYGFGMWLAFLWFLIFAGGMLMIYAVYIVDLTADLFVRIDSILGMKGPL